MTTNPLASDDERSRNRDVLMRRLRRVDDHTRHRVREATPGSDDEMRAELMAAPSRLVWRR